MASVAGCSGGVTSHPACSCMRWLCPLSCPQGDTRCLPGSHPLPTACPTPPAAQGRTWGHAQLWWDCTRLLSLALHWSHLPLLGPYVLPALLFRLRFGGQPGK